MRTFYRTSFASLAVGAAAACSTIDIGQAKKLSSAGVASSTTLQSEAKTTASRAAGWREARIFDSVIANGGTAELADSTFQQGDAPLDTLARLLMKRANALAGLVEAYKSFQALVEYGASDETEKAAASFFASTNDFLKAAQSLPPDLGGTTAKAISPISPEASEGLSIAFGIIAAEVQKGQIKKASVALRTGVETLAGALQAERQYAVAARRLLGLYATDFRAHARMAGLVDDEPTLRALLAQYDLAPAKDLGAALRRWPGGSNALEEYLKARDQAAFAMIGEAYTRQLQLLDDLVRQHQALEAGRPVKVADILALAQEIAGYVERVRSAGAATDKAK